MSKETKPEFETAMQSELPIQESPIGYWTGILNSASACPIPPLVMGRGSVKLQAFRERVGDRPTPSMSAAERDERAKEILEALGSFGKLVRDELGFEWFQMLAERERWGEWLRRHELYEYLLKIGGAPAFHARVVEPEVWAAIDERRRYCE